MGKTQVYEWFWRFKKGEMSIPDSLVLDVRQLHERAKMPTKIRALVHEDRQQTIKELENLSRLSWGSVKRILAEDLAMKRVFAKFLPRFLTDQKKDHQVETCHALKEQLQNDTDFLSKTITGDETWYYYYDPETKH